MPWKDLDQVERYARERYRHLDQRWLSLREERLIARIFTRFNLEGSILDVPVGYGRFQELLHGYGPVHALDANYYALLYQRKDKGLAKSSVTGRAQELPFSDSSFEIVFSLRLLQHISDRDQRLAMLNEFSRVSRRWVLLSLYIHTPLHLLHRRIAKRPSRITMLSYDRFIEEVQEAGLRLVKMVSVLPGLHAHRICLLSPDNPG